MASAGTITVRLILRDEVSEKLDAISWKLITLSGVWNGKQMRGDLRKRRR